MTTVIVFIQLPLTVVFGILKTVRVPYLTFRILWAVTTIYFTYNLIHLKYKPFISLPDPTDHFLLQHCKNKTTSNVWLLTLKLESYFSP